MGVLIREEVRERSGGGQSSILSSGFRPNLGPCLNHAAHAELLILSTELRHVDVSNDTPNTRVCCLTNKTIKTLSNKSVYTNSFSICRLTTKR
jgi:hypothetical protein